MISICIPVYPKMINGDFLLTRCLSSIHSQTYEDYEIVMNYEGNMAENTNAVIRKAKGDLIKILYQDDYFTHPGALQKIVEAFKPETKWLVTACSHDPGGKIHFADWSDEIKHGVNTIGSPSVLTLRKDLDIYMNESLKWVLDCDLYTRLFEKYGEPGILDDINVTIGLHDGQSTNNLSDEEKLKEIEILTKKYETN